jgi:hypothetical protein
MQRKYLTPSDSCGNLSIGGKMVKILAVEKTPELKRLESLEKVIEVGLESYREVGESLREIQESKLYKSTGYKTFEQYCEDKWGITRAAAYDYISASKVIEDLSDRSYKIGFRAARELAPLTHEERKKVAEVAERRGGFEALTVRELREEVIPEVTGKKSSVHFSSESNEWYTPEHIIEKVVKVLKKIDTDPCSNLEKTVPAKIHFTEEDDGLSKSWNGTTYMNPPYGDVIETWVDKLISEYNKGNTSEAIALVPSRTDTAWFRKFDRWPVLFVWGRLKFSESDNTAPFPSAIFYLGKNKENFKEVFSDIGTLRITEDK